MSARCIPFPRSQALRTYVPLSVWVARTLYAVAMSNLGIRHSQREDPSNLPGDMVSSRKCIPNSNLTHSPLFGTANIFFTEETMCKFGSQHKSLFISLISMLRQDAVVENRTEGCGGRPRFYQSMEAERLDTIETLTASPRGMPLQRMRAWQRLQNTYIAASAISAAMRSLKETDTTYPRSALEAEGMQ